MKSAFSSIVEQRREAVDRIGWSLSATGAVLGFLASIGVHLLPPWPPGAAWTVGPGLVLLGFAGGWATRLRLASIDSRRWRIVADDQLTSGEREYAHHEAERQRRLATTALLAGPLAIGYWTAYQFDIGEGFSLLQLFPLVPMIGYLAGWVAGRKASGSADVTHP